MKTIRKVLAAVVCMAMLLGSVTVFAAEVPTRATNPTWGDFRKLTDFVGSIMSDDPAWHRNADELNYDRLHEPAGRKLIDGDIAEELGNMMQDYYWAAYHDHESDGEEVFHAIELTGDDKTHYDAYYDLMLEFVNSIETATGECYIRDLEPTLGALHDAYVSFWDRITEIGDNEEPPEGVEWIYRSACEPLRQEHNNIFDNYWPKTDDEYDMMTREKCQQLITRLTTALNNLKAAQESGSGNFTVDIPDISEETPAETPETPAETPETSSGASAPAATETATDTAAVTTIPATSSVGVVKSTVSGAFAVEKVNGVAFTTPVSDIAAGYQLASGEKAHAMVWDLDPKKSNLAQAVIDNAATALGAEVGPALNLELGKKDTAGKYSLLSQDGSTVRIAVGVPASFVEQGKTLAVVRVRPGGAVSILPDLDEDPVTVTFETTGGAGAYAIVKY